MSRVACFVCVVLAAAAVWAEEAGGKLKLGSLFQSHVVLQRDTPVPVWGRAAPGAEVSVSVDGVAPVKAVAGADGRWMARLKPMPAGGPVKVVVSSGGESVALEDVLLGDVWLCSGQSNMEQGITTVINAQQEIAKADHPNIRLFTVSKTVSPEPQEFCGGSWSACTPESVAKTGTWGGFTAVGYFFGAALSESQKVPIGLIQSAWGGTPAEAWTPKENLAADSDLKPILDRYDENLKNFDPAKLAERMAKWEKATKEAEQTPDGPRWVDTGDAGSAQGWAKPDFDDAAWTEMKLPAPWENISPEMEIDGAVWFRKSFDLPASMAGKPLRLTLGAIDDFDTTFFNGVKVGSTGKETLSYWSHPRDYEVPAALAKAGKAVIAVRVFDHFGGGGMVGPADMMSLTAAGEAPVRLDGQWKYKVERALTSLVRPDSGVGPNNPNSPSGLFHAMIQPVAPFALKGAIWYQGESNAGRAYQYRKLLPSMITSWRKLWGQGDFTFLIVQLANYTAAKSEPAESDWAELREAQAMTAATLPATGIATAIDIGEAKDIHPKNKQDVGARLALAARKIAYGEKDIVAGGPLYKSMSRDGDQIMIAFDNVGTCLASKDGAALKGFQIAGADKKFVWADAAIHGGMVAVSSPAVHEPVAVRYAWAHNPEVANLCNKEKLPAFPFRTDDWPGATADNR